MPRPGSGSAMRSLVGVSRVAGTLVLGAIAAGTGLAGDERIATQFDGSSLPEGRRSTSGLYLTAPEAFAAVALAPDVVLIDVRTPCELVFSGAPTRMHRNVPYMMLDEALEFDGARRTYRLVVNPEFGKAIERLLADRKLDRSARLLLYCSEGERSAKAASFLASIGYPNVYTVVDGFESTADRRGWKALGLPWSYQLSKDQAYQSPSM